MQHETITKIWLLHVPLDLNYTDTILFKTKDEQKNWFLKSEHILKSFDNLTYIRDNSSIRLEGNRDEYYNCNYIVYQNTSFTNKYFYCFINQINFINQNTTEFVISTDMFQTWIFDCNLHSALVERFIPKLEDDQIGSFRYPEDIELGEMVADYKNNNNIDILKPCYVLAVNGYYNGSSWEKITPKGCSINNIPQAMSFVFSASPTGITDILSALNDAGMGDRIIACYTVPAVALNNVGGHSADEWANPAQSIVEYSDILRDIHTASYNYTIPMNLAFYDPYVQLGFYPKNRKLYCYPFNYLVVNPSGSEAKVYRYEDFKDDITFYIQGELMPNARASFVPYNYRGLEPYNYCEQTVSGNYPQLSYATDVFNSWLAKNQNIIDLNIQHENTMYNLNTAQRDANFKYGNMERNLNFITSLANQAQGLAGENPYGALVGLASTTGSYIISKEQNQRNYDLQKSMMAENHYNTNALAVAQIESQKLTPSNVVQGESSLALYNNYFQKNVVVNYHMQLQYLQRADEYFTRFGYKVNRWYNFSDIINTRSIFNYVKTGECIITGDIEQPFIDSIKNIFNSGIRLWHDPEKFLDFTDDND